MSGPVLSTPNVVPVPVCNLKFSSSCVKKKKEQEVGDINFNDRFYLTRCIQNVTVSVCKRCPVLLRSFTFFFFLSSVEIWNLFCADSASHPHTPPSKGSGVLCDSGGVGWGGRHRCNPQSKFKFPCTFEKRSWVNWVREHATTASGEVTAESPLVVKNGSLMCECGGRSTYKGPGAGGSVPEQLPGCP